MIMLFVASVVFIGLKYAQISVEHYEDTYRKEQAQLFMQNAIEWALYQISAYDRNTHHDCWSGGTFNSTDITADAHINFRATVNVQRYFLLAGSDDATTCGGLTTTISSPQSQGMISLHVVVTDDEGRVRIESRSLQRP